MDFDMLQTSMELAAKYTIRAEAFERMIETFIQEGQQMPDQNIQDFIAILARHFEEVKKAL